MKIKQLGIVSGVALATLVTASAAQAALVVVPPGLNPGDQYRLVFVTDGTRDATSTNIDDYNKFVTNDARGGTPGIDTALDVALNASGFNPNTIEWKVIGSTDSVAARDNTGTNPSSTGVPIYLIDGNRVANNNADLWDGSILTGIDRTPQESVGVTFVWSGTSDDGTVGCCGGAIGSNVAIVGVAGAFLGSGWINESVKSGSEVYQFYGISTVLTVPTPAVSVPEPSSLLGFITLGGLMLGSAVRLTGGGSGT
ncbi:MAG: PEP-CTERM sorting domain-containing protein [Microcystis sp. M54BS1]|uniref:PEP-CTERM sorting domain-containing protein n=1 Tax=unclassified Microcystis TaxID=2643300 RepID=UPI00257A9B96|nr:MULTISPECIES: PEP-CTERM sorting domain-containing protein [unclassified Microcystis]MCA2540538.1 PEP-CTERM sorting domain-containing protein [Microcystis sp. M54BS1]MCA2596645.1 PEP-CTERM sorting domain-containing protein [Microcystis sp. M38BS1]MCA2608362.1 PEP-CTERM sorting domain-containing protein [Microcystis sp. M27BS1]MCA2504427.1 PEP-CTERM sorting domain-containing protein [Microcystis sp. M62BS1]MCA2513082.1 PEP-CTERM sorting domain-containing protein [Microcystis sp. M60BS1]